jgi:Leucine-rich repeat (LRR) protein
MEESQEDQGVPEWWEMDDALEVSGESGFGLRRGSSLESSIIIQTRFSIPENLATLTYVTELVCEFNGLTVLPQLPLNLVDLHVANNELTELPACLPAGLRVLHCSNNRLVQLPHSLPLGLVHLNCSNNFIPSLPSLTFLTNLVQLECQGNMLDAAVFSVLPDCLQVLHASGNRIHGCHGLSALTCLKRLDLSHNGVLEVEWLALPPTLTELQVNSNGIREITSLPPNLLLFSAIGNQLTCLPPLPCPLKYIDCSLNRLTRLTGGESLPASLIYANVRFNRLRTLPGDMPPSLEILGCTGNLLKRDLTVVTSETWRLVQEDYREFCASRLKAYCAAVGLEHMLPFFMRLA